jgi:hypothetical protein
MERSLFFYAFGYRFRKEDYTFKNLVAKYIYDLKKNIWREVYFSISLGIDTGKMLRLFTCGECSTQ